MYFEIIDEIANIETIAIGRSIREIERLRKQFGLGGGANERGLPQSGCQMIGYTKLNCTGTKLTELESGGKDQTLLGLVRMNRDLKRRRRPQARFVLCIKNKDCEDLEVRKIYRVLPDRAASQDDLLRVVDESGEDYLYPAAYFTAIELPSEIEKALLLAS